MTTTPATPGSFDRLDVRDEAGALLSAVALTAGFILVYVVVAPVVVLGALAGGPVWAAIVLARERALGA
jgi:hypothetical protein